MTRPAVTPVEQTRLDIASVRYALTHAPAGPDRVRACEAFERLVRLLARQADDTKETPV